MQEDFSAAAMARKLCDLYEWLLRGGAPPAFVHHS
jgi:hypothetical protein